MVYTHTIVGHFPSHAEAERGVLELQKESFDLQRLSLIASSGTAEGGYWGSFIGGLFGILAGVGVLFIPRMAPIFQPNLSAQQVALAITRIEEQVRNQHLDVKQIFIEAKSLSASYQSTQKI